MSSSNQDNPSSATTFRQASAERIKFGAIGIPYVDHHAFEQPFKTGNIQFQASDFEGPVSQTRFQELLSQSSVVKKSLGSGAANICVTLSKLGYMPYFYGRTGDDVEGNFFRSSLASHNVQLDPNNVRSGCITDQCLIYNDCDCERQIVATSQTGINIDDQDLAKISSGIQLVYLELSLLHSDENRTHIEEFLNQENSDFKVACGLISQGTAEAFRDDVRALMEDGKIDILFGNYEEMKALASVENENELRAYLASKTGIYVVTLGERGAFIANEGHIINIEPIKCTNIVDTTGAGDQFAAGVLYGYMEGWDVVRTGNFASRLSHATIQNLGQDLDLNLVL